MAYRDVLEARRQRRAEARLRQKRAAQTQASKQDQATETLTPAQRGGLGVAPGGLPIQARPSLSDIVRARGGASTVDPAAAAAARKGAEAPGLGVKLGTKLGPTALKQAARLLPKQAAPSHDMSPETRREMAEQRAGERATISLPELPPSPAEMAAGTAAMYGPGFAAQYGNTIPADYYAGLVSTGMSPQHAGEVMRLMTQDPEMLNAYGAGTGVNIAPTQSGGGLQVPPTPEGPTGGMGVGGPSSSSGMSMGNIAGGVGGALNLASGGYGLYKGIKDKNPVGAAMGGAGAVSGASALSGAMGGPTLATALGPAVGNVVGPALGGLAGAYGLYSGIKNEDPQAAAAGGVGLASSGLAGLAATGAIAGGMGAATAATGVGAAFAAALIIGPLLESLGISSRKPTPAEISRLAGTQAAQNLAKQLPAVVSLPQLAKLMNTQWSPHDELQIVSGGAANSDEFKAAIGALHNDQYLGQGQGAEWVDPFVRGLDVKYGETGNLDKSDPLASWMMKSQIAQGLPDLPAYQQLKADMAPGGALYEAEKARLGTQQQWMAGLPFNTTQFGGESPQQLNTFDPYTWQGTHPDGTTFQLSPQVMQDYSINPYTYGLPGYDGSAELTYGGGGQSGEQTNFNPPQQYYVAHPSLQPTAINPYVASNMQPFDMSAVPAQQGGMNVGAAPTAEVATAPPTGAIDPGVQAAAAGKRSPTFATPELDNRAEAAAGKLGGKVGADADQGVPFGTAGKRPGPFGMVENNRGGFSVGPRGGRPGGQAPFGGSPQQGMQPMASGARVRPNRRTEGAV